MERIIDGRGTGKTYKLLKFAQEHDAIVVCSNPHTFSCKAQNLRIYGLKFISYQDFLFSHGGRGYDSPFVIDELENFVRTMMPENLIGYSLSNED